jgi:hypothetical protein
MFEVMLFEAELAGLDIKRPHQQGAHIAHRLFALSHANEIQNLVRICQGILHFLGEVSIAILADRDVLNVRNSRSHRIQAGFNGKRGKTSIVLLPIQPFFGNRENDFPILHDGSRGVGMKHIEAQNQHEQRSILPND